jgi:uncharacterized protein YbaR (Trm112 family)
MKRYDASEIRAMLASRRNIAEWIREREGSAENSAAALLYAYDAQAGSYTEAMRDPAQAELKARQAGKLAAILDELAPVSVMDAGTGEASTFAPTLSAMRRRPAWATAFDLSISRLLYGRAYLLERGLEEVELVSAALERIPFGDSAVDTVLTFHAVEGNHGREEEILRELLRVAARHLVMVEPSWEFATPEIRERMRHHGYVRGLPELLNRLGATIVRHEPWGLDINPLNPAALIVVSKSGVAPDRPRLISPISGKSLVRRADSLFCPDDGHAFPILAGIPSMLLESAILCSHLASFN